MMTTNEKTSTFARIALGATAVLALAGHAHAAVTTCEGATGTYNTVTNRALTSNADACVCAPGYTSTPGGVAAVTGTTGLDCIHCVAGYYFSVAGGAGALQANAVCTQVPAGKFFDNSVAPKTAITAVTAEVLLSCPALSTSVAGATAKTQCTVLPGYYLATGDNAGAGTVASPLAPVIRQVPAGYYAEGGVDVTQTANTHALGTSALTLVIVDTGANSGVKPCPYAGTSSAGATALTACSPDCNTTNQDSNAIALGGTCVCAAGTYTVGAPQDIFGLTGAAAVKKDTRCVPCTSATGTFQKAGAGVTTFIGATANTHCVTSPGYIRDVLTAAATDLAPVKAPANTYFPGFQTPSTVAIDYAQNCPKHSTSAAGSSKLSDCKCIAGYSATANSCEPCAGRAAGDAVGTHVTCTATTTTTTAAATPGAPGAPGAPAAASGASSVSVFAAAAAIAAAQLVL